MVVLKQFATDVEVILAKRRDNGADFWATADGRWGKGSPFSTYDCVLSLTELGLPRTHPALKGAAEVLFGAWCEDGRIRPAPKGSIHPCHSAHAARALCRLGYARDRRLARTLEHFFERQHEDGGWRCNTVKAGKAPETDASNPGVTLAVLDAFRFTAAVDKDKRLDKAVSFLLAHWTTRKPLGPCHFGIGTLFLQVEYPYLRYNLFAYLYVLSFYASARKHKSFRQAQHVFEEQLVDDQVVVGNPNRGLAKLAFCAKGKPSRLATRRYHEILKRLDG